VAIGAALHIFQWYRSRPLWLDEEMIALNVRDRTLAELAGPLWLGQSAPLGWLALQRMLLVEFGTSERTLRALPVLAGIGTLLIAFWAGRRWMGAVGALIFVVLCSFGAWIAFYPLELKPYSADVFGALLLAALAVWALEPAAGSPSAGRRAALWWVTAAAGHWFCNGALLVTPGCALIMFIVTWHRAGWRRAFPVALMGVTWLASFGLHYQLSIRHAFHSEYLENYWRWALAPEAAGIGETLSWLARRFELLAVEPGGTRLWITFWLVAAFGIAHAVSKNTPLGLVLFTIPVSAFLLAALRLMPLAERLSLWVLPALYAGIGLAADAVARFAQMAFLRRSWIRLSLSVLAAAVVLRLCWDVYQAGAYERSVRPQSNHAVDDRAGVRFLLAHGQRNDVLVTSSFGLPAVWWYGGVSVADPNRGRTNEQDGSPIFEVRHFSPGPGCLSNDWKTDLGSAKRVALYLGFASNIPKAFQELVLDRLSELGEMTTYRAVAEEGRAAIFDLTRPPKSWTLIVPTAAEGHILQPIARPGGCVRPRRAERW